MVEFKQMKNVRVRIAPSPTGFAHVGTAYTALFNYAFARHNNGTFIIRIEDSDLKRNVAGAEEKIYKALEWLGISWDEGATKGGDYGPYKLSERLDIYKQKALELLDRGLAYEDEGAIRFKNPEENISWNDLVRGEIKFPGGEITDFVMIKSDGYPTYNFNVVVDDIAMKISHVIRGEDHISNTPRQIALYKAFEARIPEFAHHPMLLNQKRQKLSKRDAAVDIEEYKKQGILPEAFINFLCLMGWSHPTEKEIFNLDEFVEKFSLDRVRKSGAIFDMAKLEWINGQYLQSLSDDEFLKRVRPYILKEVPDSLLEKLIPLVKTRIKKLSEFESFAGYFYKEVKPLALTPKHHTHISNATRVLEQIPQSDWNLLTINKTLMDNIKSQGFKTGDYFMDLRGTITGSQYTPPINDSIEILGKEETVKRLKKGLR